jgi:Protein of unknown function (DUF2815)
MIKTVASGKFKTPLCVLAFSQGLFVPKSVVEGAPKKYGATLIYENSVDKTAFSKAIKEVADGAWGDKFEGLRKAGAIKMPFLAGDGPSAHNKGSGELYAGFGPDKFFIRPQSGEKQPPVIRSKALGEQTPADEIEVYSGCIGWAVLHCFSWWHQTGGQGISFGIDMFCKVQDGERLGGGGPVDPSKWWDNDDAPKTNGGGASSLFD